MERPKQAGRLGQKESHEASWPSCTWESTAGASQAGEGPGALVGSELYVSQQHMQCIQLIPKTSRDKSKWIRVSGCKAIYVLTYQIMGENKSDLILHISQTSVMSLTRFLSIPVLLSSTDMAENHYLPVTFSLKHTPVESFRLEMLLDWKAVHRQHKYWQRIELKMKNPIIDRDLKSSWGVKCWYYCECKRKSNF